MVSKKQQKKIDELREIIFLCESVMRDADNQHDYEVAERELFQKEVELQELEQRVEQ